MQEVGKGLWESLWKAFGSFQRGIFWLQRRCFSGGEFSGIHHQFWAGFGVMSKSPAVSTDARLVRVGRVELRGSSCQFRAILGEVTRFSAITAKAQSYSSQAFFLRHGSSTGGGCI